MRYSRLLHIFFGSCFGLFTAGGLSRANAQPFTEISDTGIWGVQGAALAWGDSDGDGDLDLVWNGGNGVIPPPASRIYRNDGSNGFTQVAANLLGIEYGSVDWGDFDNDGDLDLVLAGQSWPNSYARIYRNDGSNVFTALSASLPGIAHGTSSWGDYDNDGDLDLLLGGIFRNNGEGTFTDIRIGFPSGRGAEAAWGDFDNDGDLDVAYVGHSSDALVIYRNDGADRFTGIVVPSYHAATPQMNVVDFNNDGLLDVAVDSYAFVSSVLFRNGGGLSFQIVTNAFPRNFGSWNTWGDINADGYSDVLFSTRLFHNVAGLAFTNVWDPASSLSRPAIGDWDGDGDLDVVFSGVPAGFSLFKLYRNGSQSSNPSPAAPSGLAATVTGTTAVLSWQQSTDQNQSGGLTYNVRVGTGPGRVDVVGPMADPQTGRRLKPARGNAGTRLEWPLRNLAVGTYYWSVQAIDNGFSGSPFAAEISFSLTQAPPIAVSGKASAYANATAQLSGHVHPNAMGTTWHYEYGTDTNYGTTTPWVMVAGGTNRVPVGVTISNLHLGAPYHFRLVASNVAGITLGTDEVFLSAPQFTTRPAIGARTVKSDSMEWGDYDNDGWMDLVVTGWDRAIYQRFTAIFRNNQGTSFTEYRNLVPGAVGATWGDFNNDGRLDLLLAGVSTNYAAQVWRNMGASFVLETNALPTNVGAFAQWVDFDGDDRLDVAMAASSGVQLHRNAGNGTFPLVQSNIFAAQEIHSIAWGDYDMDGDADLLVTGYQWPTGYTRILRNDADRFILTDHNIPGLEESNEWLLEGSTQWLDFEGDGDLDVLMQGTFHLGHLGGGLVQVKDGVSLFLQNTPNRFSEIELGGYELRYHGGTAWGDVDNDGRIDLAYSGTDLSQSGPQTRVLRNLGGQTFGLPVELGQPWGGPMRFGDFDNDRDLDLALIPGEISASGGPTLHLFRNNEADPNALPQAPTNLRASISGDTTVLSWAATTDANQLYGHTYAVRVGTQPQAGDVVSQPANAADGFRRQPVAGNAGARRVKILRALAPGTYYWSVQAVDSAFAGSPFASESTFTIGPRILSIRLISDSAVELAVEGALGSQCTLQESASLWSWSNALSFQFHTNRMSLVREVTSDQMPRFFRIRLN